MGLNRDELTMLANYSKHNNKHIISNISSSINTTGVQTNDKLENNFPHDSLNAKTAHINIGKTVKTSRRDLAYVLSQNWNGATTVAGTLIVANLVGIKIFATGGIGMYTIYTLYIKFLLPR